VCESLVAFVVHPKYYLVTGNQIMAPSLSLSLTTSNICINPFFFVMKVPYSSTMAVVMVTLRIALILSLSMNVIFIMVVHHNNNNNTSQNNHNEPRTVSPYPLPIQTWRPTRSSPTTANATNATNANATNTTATTRISTVQELVSEQIFEIGGTMMMIMTKSSSTCQVTKNVEFILSNFTKHAVVDSLSNMTMKFDHPVMRFDIPYHYYQINNNKYNNRTTKGYATCVRKRLGWEEDFPHWFQQISRCWTFWQIHSHLRPIWMTDADHPKYNNWIRRFIDLMPNMGILPILYNNNNHTNNSDVYVITGNFQRRISSSSSSSNISSSCCNSNNYTSSSTIQINNNHTKKNNDASVTAYSMPTWPSKVGFQTTSIDHMRTLRTAVLNAIGYQEETNTSHLSTQKQQQQQYGCPVLATDNNNNDPPIPRIAMINRKKTRKLLNGPEILMDGKNHTHLPYDIPIYYLEEMTFDQQVRLMADIDIIITPHGAQQTNLVFMPPCGAIIEVLPDRYFVPKYYGTLAASAGLDHAVLYLANHLTDKSVDGTTKQHSMCLPLDSTRYAIRRMIDRWKNCCHRRSRRHPD
jgi:hypothetical protein